jgi:hypothetical protein
MIIGARAHPERSDGNARIRIYSAAACNVAARAIQPPPSTREPS